MKKIVAIIIVVVLCMCMSACSNENNNQNNIPDISENNDYIENDVTETESQTEEYQKEVLDILTGEWDKYTGDETQYQAVIMNDDGTVRLQNVEYKWRIDRYWSDDSSNINSIDVEILASDDNVVETLEFLRNYDHNNDRDGTFEMKVVGTDDFFCNKNDFEIIEITTENFDDYFELRDMLKAEKSEDGLYSEYPVFGRGWVLKGDMRAAIDKTEISYEYSYQSSCRNLKYDRSTGSFAVLEATIVYDNVYNNIEDEFGVAVMDDVLFGCVGNPFVSKINGFEINGYPENIKLEDVSGTLCIYK